MNVKASSDNNWWCRECILWHPKDMGASPAEAHAEWERRIAAHPDTQHGQGVGE